MGSLALTSLVIGAAIGLRFRVFALFPLILLNFLAIPLWGLTHDWTIGTTVLMAVVSATCLQFGYLGGTLPRFVIIAARLAREETAQSVRPLAR